MGATDRPRHRARKRFGQHFLEPVWARKVVDAIAPRDDETFLEIGPGTGAITRLLAARVRALVACEIDRDLAALVREAAIPNLRVIERDFLAVDADTLMAALDERERTGTIRVAGNLPYNVASPIMFRLVDLHRQGADRRRISDAAARGRRAAARLARHGRLRHPHRARRTSRTGHPAAQSAAGRLPAGPRVQSTVVRLQFHPPDPPVADERILAGVTTAVFSRRRKTMGNALLAYGGLTADAATRALADAGIDPQRRPETLSIHEFGHLADSVARLNRT